MTASTVGARSPRLLQMIALVSTLDRFAMPPMLIAMAHALGAPLSAIVTAAGAYFLAYGLMQPLWGAASDRIGLVDRLLPAAGFLDAVLDWVATEAARFRRQPPAPGR